MTQTVFQTPTANAVVDYVPQKQYPSFSVQTNENITLTVATAGSGVTLTAAQLLGGLITHDTSSSGRTDTLDTAANIVNAIEGAAVGSTISFLIRNASAGAGSITLVAGTGGTLSGTTATSVIPYLQQEQYLLRVTAIGTTPTYTVYGLGLITF